MYAENKACWRNNDSKIVDQNKPANRNVQNWDRHTTKSDISVLERNNKARLSQVHHPPPPRKKKLAKVGGK